MFKPCRVDWKDHDRRVKNAQDAKRRARLLLAEGYYPFNHRKTLPLG